MASCERFETEISAFADGELGGTAALLCVDHLLTCPSCREYYRDARGMDDLLDAAHAFRHLSDDAGELWFRVEDRDGGERRHGRLGSAPAWALRIAATLVAATALWLFGASRLETSAQEAPLIVEVGAQPKNMNEDKFVDMTRELLESDRRYQRKMLEILSAVNEDSGLGEGPGLARPRAEGSENADASAFRGEELSPSPRIIW